ncbi:MAG: phytanoyl-CoA dioxygenase family protein [Candidatus Binatia bacterium]|nr:phytanoyl-CoA dioxygenase family protein [Candidatus Binatia bacterium]
MAVEHLSPNTTPERAAEILDRDGCVVIDGLESPTTFDRIRAELEPWFAANGLGPDEFTGHHTKRTGALIARSETARDVIQNPLVLGTTHRLLADATSYHLHLTQIIAIEAGESEQPIHRDQWAFDFFPFPSGYEVQCNTLWAMTDFTQENGATRVIPGSNKFPDKQEFTIADTEPAEMDAGSVLLYTGALYHGGGPNRSDATRYGMNITYARSWLRQEENQYLTVPQDIARDLPEPLLRLMGYSRGAYALGYIDDMRDPLKALRESLGEEAGLGDFASATAKRTDPSGS